MEPYQVKLEQFEGPFPLLLALVERERLDVTMVSLAKIADQYLEYISNRDVSLPYLSEFVSVASRLLLLKSRALLPRVTLETETEEPPLEELEAKLREYRRYREASLHLANLLMFGKRCFRRASKTPSGVFVYPEGISAQALHGVFRGLLRAIPDSIQIVNREVEESISLDDCIAILESRLLACKEAVFSDIVSESKTAIEVIISFLALLELVRRRSACADQGSLFAEIRFSRIES